jgi:hypothetical protein
LWGGKNKNPIKNLPLRQTPAFSLPSYAFTRDTTSESYNRDPSLSFVDQKNILKLCVGCDLLKNIATPNFAGKSPAVITSLFGKGHYSLK